MMRLCTLTVKILPTYEPPRFAGSFDNCIGRWLKLFCMPLVLLLDTSAALAADGKGPACYGLTLPAGSKKVDPATKECRYVSSMNWDETLRFLDRALPSAQTRWHREVNIPQAKYVHVENTHRRAGWEGVNIYTLGADQTQVHLYVIPRSENAPRKSTGANEGNSNLRKNVTNKQK
jgi:hypothetical protein